MAAIPKKICKLLCNSFKAIVERENDKLKL